MAMSDWETCTKCWKSFRVQDFQGHTCRRGRQNRSPAIMEDIQPFVSPVDGKVIGSRSALREHNKRNGVIQLDEWSNQGELNRKEHEKVFEKGNPDRINDIRKSMGDFGGTNE